MKQIIFVICLFLGVQFIPAPISLNEPVLALTPYGLAQDKTKLTLGTIKELILNKTPDTVIAGEIGNRGIRFMVRQKTISDLLKIGAGPQTIRILSSYIRPQPPVPTRNSVRIPQANPGPSRTWEIVRIQSRDQYRTIEWDKTWTDISWLESEGWLCGTMEESGGSGDVGRGILLHTKDYGNSWIEVEKSSFSSGKGKFTWGPEGNRLYSWMEVGPIKSLSNYREHLGGGSYKTELYLASSTGIYLSDDDGMKWRRLTPPPDDPKRYALFNEIVGIENYSEIYAVGWQGIAHWYRATQRWEVQKEAYDYGISGIASTGGSENRSVWAVGRAGIDELGNYGDRSHGAIYHLRWPHNRWEPVPLPGVKFDTAQSFTAILLVDYDTVFAIGDRGLVVRGSKKDEKWTWMNLKVPTEVSLKAMTFASKRLWIVGDEGVILESPDNGNTWDRTVVKDAQGKAPNLQRIRFFGDAGWVVGTGIVLKSVAK